MTMLNILFLLFYVDLHHSVSSLFPVVGDLLWNKMLVNSCFAELHGDSLVDCATECLTRTACSSFNYKRNFQLCQLNNKSSRDGDKQFVKESGYVYSNIETWPKDWAGCKDLLCPVNYRYLPFNCSCMPSECGQPPDIVGASFLMDAGLQNIESKVVYRCKDGFKSNVAFVIAECNKNGSWSNVDLMCKVDCGKPPSLQNSTRMSAIENTTVGATVEYTCNQGFRSTSALSVACLSSGNWSSPSSSCNIISCKEPDPLNGAILDEGSNVLGTVRTYTCDKSFKSFGDMTIVCQKNETWTLLQGSCKKLCRQPPDIEHATTVAVELHAGSKYTYVCQKPGIASGNMTIQCLNSGLWSPLQGRCIIDCREPTQVIPNSNLQQGNSTEGSKRQYVCKVGFYASGSGNLVCQKNGIWTTATLKCENCLTMKCSSHNYQYSACDAKNEVKSVVLKKQLSKSSCSGNYGIHTNGNSIFVKSGCRGEFQVCYK